MWYYVVDFDADTIGTYSIYFTASKDGYSVSSNPKMLTVTKLNLSKAVITFPNGNESVYQPYNTTTGVPPYVVTYNGSELKAGVDYTVVRGDSRSTVGRHSDHQGDRRRRLHRPENRQMDGRSSQSNDLGRRHHKGIRWHNRPARKRVDKA